MINLGFRLVGSGSPYSSSFLMKNQYAPLIQSFVCRKKQKMAMDTNVPVLLIFLFGSQVDTNVPVLLIFLFGSQVAVNHLN